jgi:glycerophosphoryl diester phosphodiesterase
MNHADFHTLRADLQRPLVMAHRGASAILPENSLSAFQRAVADGADILETDLHFSQDDEILLIHDDTLDRTVEASGQVRDFTLSDIRKFKLRQPASRHGKIEQVPTLRELIELTEAQIPLALELKDPLFELPHYGEKLVAVLRDTGLLGRCAVISFSQQKMKTVESLAPELVGGWITLVNFFPTQPAELLGPFWPLLILNPFYVAWAHKLGKIVAPLDPNPEARLGLYLKLDVDVILSDNPALTLTEIRKRL